MLNVYDLKIAHPDIFKQYSVKKNLFVHYKCPQSERLVELYNHYNEILFTLSGKKSIHKGKQTFTMTDDQALLVRKTAYVQEMYEDLDWEVIAFHFDDHFLTKVFSEFIENFPNKNIPEFNNEMIFHVKINELIRSNFYGLLSFFTNEANPSEYVLELKIRELMINMLSEPQNGQILAFFHHVGQSRKNPLWEVMENNYTFNLSLEEFAKMSQRSLSTFRKDFKNYYQTTPGKWLIEKRLLHAKDHLLDTTRNISEIAYDSGFENLSHFSRVFKDKFGVSPLHYRTRSA